MGARAQHACRCCGAGRPSLFSLRIKHLADCHLAKADLSPVFAHDDKETYHVAKGCWWTPRWRPSLSRFLGPVLDRQARKLRKGAVVGHQDGVDAQGV